MRKLILIFYFLIQLSPLSAQNILSKIDTIGRIELFFDSGDSIIQEKADTVFKDLILLSRSTKLPSIRISAHTDNIGSKEANKALSLARAMHVDSLVRTRKVKFDSIYIRYVGEDEPSETNRTEEGRQANRKVALDLLEYKTMVNIKRVFFDSTGQIGKDIEVRYQLDYKNGIVKPDSAGLFSFYAPIDETLSLFYFKKGYMFGEELIQAQLKDTIVEERQIEKLRKDLESNVAGLNFYGASAEILKYHKPRLKDLLDYMLLNDNITILIKGHVNQPNKPPAKKNTFTYRLGEDRAKTVFMYLFKNGVHPDRMEYQSFSNWELLYPKPKNLIENRKNRRVEIKITGIDFQQSTVEERKEGNEKIEK